jgi:hypothetical protein
LPAEFAPQHPSVSPPENPRPSPDQAELDPTRQVRS